MDHVEPSLFPELVPDRPYPGKQVHLVDWDRSPTGGTLCGIKGSDDARFPLLGANRYDPDRSEGFCAVCVKRLAS